MIYGDILKSRTFLNSTTFLVTTVMVMYLYNCKKLLILYCWQYEEMAGRPADYMVVELTVEPMTMAVDSRR